MNVYKYDLFSHKEEISGLVEIDLPKDAEMLTVQVQDGKIVLYALVDPEAPNEKRRVHLLFTGEKIDGRPGKHLSTVQFFRGLLVTHFFADR